MFAKDIDYTDRIVLIKYARQNMELNIWNLSLWMYPIMKIPGEGLINSCEVSSHLFSDKCHYLTV